MLKHIVGKFYKSDPTPKPLTPPNGQEDVFFTDKRTFPCDGPSFSGHPRVFLTIPQGETQTYCPYCSRLYKIQ